MTHRLSRRLEPLRDRVAALSLSTRFALAGSLVMLAAAVAAGAYVTEVIERAAISTTAGATALLMDSVVGPLAQELQDQDTLSIGPILAIEELMSATGLGKRVVSVKIWKRDGLVAYAENNALIGERFPVSDSLTRAFAGEIVAEFDELDDEESAAERAIGLPLIEVYSPLRKAWSGDVIAVAEFYEDATELERTLAEARRESWALVVAAAIAIAGTLFGIVRSGSRTIDLQRRALRERAEEAERAAEQNRELRLRVERAVGRAAEVNERFLRRISADLHDGPAQLVSLASLRLNRVATAAERDERAAEAGVVKSALDEAMRDIRHISAGLSLPNIEGAPLAAVVADAARAHERYTGTTVALGLGALPEGVAPSVKICAFRFVQEGLNNAFRHAAGIGQRVEASMTGSVLRLTVLNAAPDGAAAARPGGGLGLQGLRDRVESLGGQFAFAAPPGEMVRTTMTIDLGPGERRG